MSILTGNNLGLSFGAFDLFRGISVSVANDSKIGLIGPNGIGKTSLLLILAGLSLPTTGSVNLARGRHLGYLRQEAVEAFSARENRVYAEMLAVFAGLQAEQERLHKMEAEMASGRSDAELLEAYGAAQRAFEQAGGYDYELRIQQTLEGLGLDKTDWERPLCQLSGGQQTRALLAKLLLERPDLLILDEPTNHLDIEAVAWLEQTLQAWPGALIVVSHDRYFLDRVADTIWEMGRAGIEVYSGNYSAYLLQRQERWERMQQVYIEEKARLQREIDFVQRNIVRASTNARAVGLLRRLSRDLAVVETYGIQGLREIQNWHDTGLRVKPWGVVQAIRFINAIPEPDGRPPQLKLRLNPVHNSGNIVLRARHLLVGYPGNRLFTLPEVELRRGERAALLGPNGSGKTTFLKTLLGQIQPLSGQVQLGASLRIGYYSQAQEALDPASTVITELTRHKEMLEGEARSYLAQYLFRGEDVFKPVSALSGGERARLALAILALQGANFLLLDEPTNHLDIPAQEALQEVLEEFPGTILLVTHDRYLVDRLATQVWEILGGQLRVFQGTYRQYLEWQEKANALPRRASARPAASAQPGRPVSSAREPLPRTNGAATARRSNSNSAASRRSAASRARSLQALEARIQEAEASLERLNRELESADRSKGVEQLQSLSWKYVETQQQLDRLMAEWENLAA